MIDFDSVDYGYLDIRKTFVSISNVMLSWGHQDNMSV